ncbi:hypothetical protein [Cohnella luojiensis]|uniref:Uncharacterized protein n=1 Tax=Cohnella luojiensis TaxID=652876 RepID=A0A4Y8M1K9_9BACL|nr:hypothetical protein [Cohnella luojiensis]TFE28997.1 hypothetical protein E2980_06295 [Cohnella luojiensis]
MVQTRILLSKTVMMILTMVLSLGFMSMFSQRTYAAVTNAPAPIRITSTATVQVKSAELFTQEKGLYLIYTLTYTNNGNTTLQLDDFWSKAKSTSGKIYSTSVVDKDKKTTRLSGKSSVDITYYSPVDDNATLSKLIISIVKWDFSVPNYTRNIGAFNLAKGYGATTAAFLPKYLFSKESKLKTAIKGVQSSIDNDERILKINFLMENLNTREYRATTTQFYVVATDGSVYAAKNDTLKDLIIQPKERKIITLQVKLPVIANEKGIKLLTGYLSEADGIYIPIASYQVPKGATQSSAEVSQLSYGNYLIEITGYGRLPTGTQDTLTANFKITNKGKTGLKIPQLKASWSFNGIAQKAGNELVVAYDQRVQLEPNASIQMIASTQVPYSATLSDIRVSLKEIADDQTEKVVGQFKSIKVNEFKDVTNQIAEFDRLAAKTSLELLRVRSSVEGRQFNISGDLAITNLEPRTSNLQKYGVYLRGEDGLIYPLTIGNYAKTVITNGKILVPFSGKVPVSSETAKMNILIAELIPTVNEGSTPSTTIPGSVVSMTTVWPASIPQSQFFNLNVGNYNLSMDKFYAYLDYSSGGIQGLNLDFEYSMLIDSSFDDIAGPYKLRIEIEDQNSNKLTLAKDIEMDSKSQEFKEGQAIKKTIQFTDPNLSSQAEFFKEYKLSIYCVTNDQKVLLAQRAMPYFYIQWLEFQDKEK